MLHSPNNKHKSRSKLCVTIQFLSYTLHWKKFVGNATLDRSSVKQWHECSFVVGHPSLWKMVLPTKNYFSPLFWKTFFFFFLKYCYIKNIKNLISYKKVYNDFCRQTPPSPQNGHVLPQMVFHNFFNINL